MSILQNYFELEASNHLQSLQKLFTNYSNVIRSFNSYIEPTMIQNGAKKSQNKPKCPILINFHFSGPDLTPDT